MNLLNTYYAIQQPEKVFLDQREGFKSGEYVYFIMSAANREAIHMEQAALAYYLMENNYTSTAIPIPNIQGEWFTTYNEIKYAVLQVRESQGKPKTPHGQLLANFHQIGAAYSYEPQEISSYGQWKQLWIHKLTIFENQIEQESKRSPSTYYQHLLDVLPYIIGISENAIQYLQETEHESRYHEGDKSTITFHRYSDNCVRPVLWANDLVYDHPTRDLAEFIRTKLVRKDKQSMEEITLFMKEYQSIRPLSVFSWRVLYARLLFPTHMFDIIARGFDESTMEQSHTELVEVVGQQTNYEKRLADLFHMVGVEHESLDIPVVQWL